ncbi:MAG: hypothetical protein ACYCW6_11750 [Candidatus Xenobia bacterium]
MNRVQLTGSAAQDYLPPAVGYFHRPQVARTLAGVGGSALLAGGLATCAELTIPHHGSILATAQIAAPSLASWPWRPLA